MSGAYALVRTGPTLPLPPIDHASTAGRPRRGISDGGGGGSQGDDRRQAPHDASPELPSDTEILQSIYESYALRYPNPRVVDARREIQRRLYEEKLRSQGGELGGGGGSFSRIFGGGGSKKQKQLEQADSDHVNKKSPSSEEEDPNAEDHQQQSDEGIEEDEREKRRAEELNAELSRYDLCGTDVFEDGITSVVPDEARRSARFHLASCGHSGQKIGTYDSSRDGGGGGSIDSDTVRICRTGNVSYRVTSAVVGWGQIAEFHRIRDDDDGEGDEGVDEKEFEHRPTLSFTSDANLLLPSIEAYDAAALAGAGQQDRRSQKPLAEQRPDLRRVRTASLGPNCIAISWGCRDGIVVLYRRVHSKEVGMGWDAVACIEPSIDVVDAAANGMTLPADGMSTDALAAGATEEKGRKRKNDKRQQQQQRRTPTPFALDLMRVADLIPMVLEDESFGGDDDEQLQQQAPKSDGSTILLAIARLGGYVDIIPVPTSLCRGPVFKPKHPKRQHGGSGRPHHYSASLPVLRVQSAKAISTTACHHDITALDVHRSGVSADTEWDCNARPDAPPSEFLLAASGASGEGEGECVTLWGVASVYSAPERLEKEEAAAVGDESSAVMAQQEMEFSIHVFLVGIVDLVNVGPPVTTFASDITSRQWDYRAERNVRRRITSNGDDDKIIIPSAESDISRPCTVTTSAPFTRLRFTPCPSDQLPLLLCALDYNGGTTVLDCTGACLVATHEAPPPLSRRPDDDESASANILVAIDVLYGRESTLKWASLVRDGSCGAILESGWWWPATAPADHQLPLLMSLSDRGGLDAYNIDAATEDGEDSQIVFHGDVPIGAAGTIAFISSPMLRGPFAFILLSSRQLSACAVKSLDPVKLVFSLMDEGRNREAIEMTKKLAGFVVPPDVMNICYKSLWEDEYDVDALLQVPDVHYFINAALSLGDCGRSIPLTIEQVSGIYVRAVEMATSTTSEFDDVDKEAIQHLRSHLVKAGSYILLAQHFGSNILKTSAWPFLSMFLGSGAVLDVALACARRGDISSLTIIFVRHFDEIGSNRLRAQVLERLPLGLSVEAYSHLLPLSANETGGSFCYGDNNAAARQPFILQSSELASRMQREEGLTFYLNDQDKLRTIEHVRMRWQEHTLNENSQFDISQWFGERAHRIHTLTGLLEPAVAVCSFGLRRLRDNDAGKQRLLSFCATAHHLNRIITDDNLLLDDATSAISVTEFVALGLQGVVRLILGARTVDKDADVASTMIARYKELLEPMIKADDNSLPMRHWFPNDEGDAVHHPGRVHGLMQHAITSYCVTKIQQSAKSDELVPSLEMCRAFADASKTAIPKSDRIIRDEADLVDFVMNIAYIPGISCSRPVLDTLWALYECLPVRVKSRESSDERWVSLSATIDAFYRHLLVVEIGLRWCLDSRIVGTMRDLRHRAEGSDNSNAIALGCNILAAMCDVLCSRLKSLGSNEQEEQEAILDFLSDVQELNELCFDSTLPIEAELERHVVRSLLYQYSFRPLKTLVTTKSDWFNSKSVESAISEFVLETMTSPDNTGSSSQDEATDNRRDMLRAAIECQDIFGPIFPDLRRDFDSSRRYLDVAHFVHDVLTCKLQPEDSHSTSPIASLASFRSTPAVDIITAVLIEKPSAILLGCPDWGDASFAAGANFDVASYFARIDSPTDPSDSGPPDASKLPPPPGGYVMQLSGMLGLGENSLSVRTKMAQHAAAAGFFGAASAICYLLIRDIIVLHEQKQVPEDRNLEVDLLQAISTIVASESYADFRMQRELCILSIRHLGDVSNMGYSDAFDAVLKAFPALEARASTLNLSHGPSQVSAAHFFDATEEGRSEPAIQHDSPKQQAGYSTTQEQASGFLVFKAAGLISRQAKKVVNEVKKSGELIHHHSIDRDPNSPPFATRPSISDTRGAYEQILSFTSTDVHRLLSDLQSNCLRSGLDEDNDALMKNLARHILFWCVSQFGKERPDGFNHSAVSSQVSIMLQLGLSILLELSPDDCCSILEDVERALEAEESTRCTHTTSSFPTTKPDGDLVRRLCERGYGVNASRRAAAMTNNADLNAAVAWCVAHFDDLNFNDPLIFLRSDETNSLGAIPHHSLMTMVKSAVKEARQYSSSGLRFPIALRREGAERDVSSSDFLPETLPANRSIAEKNDDSFGWDDDDIDFDDGLKDESPAVEAAEMSPELPVRDEGICGLFHAQEENTTDSSEARNVDHANEARALGEATKKEAALSASSQPSERLQTTKSFQPSSTIPAAASAAPERLAPADSSPLSPHDPTSRAGGWDEDDDFDGIFDDDDDDHDLGGTLKTEAGQGRNVPDVQSYLCRASPGTSAAPTPPKSSTKLPQPSLPKPDNSSRVTNGAAFNAGAVSAVTQVQPPPTPSPPQRSRHPTASTVQGSIKSPMSALREQSQRLGDEERRRMVDEGRRLLREKRAVQSSSPSSSMRPKTRSMTSSTPGKEIRSSTTSRPIPKTGVTITDPTERQRLVLEGRRLLEEARKSKKNAAATDATAKARPPPPPWPPRTPSRPTTQAKASPRPPPPPPAPPSVATQAPVALLQEPTKKLDKTDDGWDDFDKFDDC